jgi:fructosamine-3-kinase
MLRERMTKDKKSKILILKEYKQLEVMSRALAVHQKEVHVVGKSIAKKMSTNMKYGLMENLNTVEDHLSRARKEIGKALSELELI